MEHLRDTFFITNKFDLETKKQILIDSKELAMKWWVDILDIEKSFTRTKIEMSFEDILTKLDNKSHFVLIHRKGYSDNEQEFYGEVGFSTMTVDEPNYFLWINLKVDDFYNVIKKHNLKEL